MFECFHGLSPSKSSSSKTDSCMFDLLRSQACVGQTQLNYDLLFVWFEYLWKAGKLVIEEQLLLFCWWILRLFVIKWAVLRTFVCAYRWFINH